MNLFLMFYYLFLVTKIYFVVQFQNQSKNEQKVQSSHMCSSSHKQLSPLSMAHTTVVHSLNRGTKRQSPPNVYSLHQDSSLYCTLYGLDKCIMVSIHDCSIVQTSFNALKILCAVSMHPCLPHNPWKCTNLFILSFCRMSCSWNHTVRSPLRLASFTQ